MAGGCSTLTPPTLLLLRKKGAIELHELADHSADCSSVTETVKDDAPLLLPVKGQSPGVIKGNYELTSALKVPGESASCQLSSSGKVLLNNVTDQHAVQVIHLHDAIPGPSKNDGDTTSTQQQTTKILELIKAPELPGVLWASLSPMGRYAVVLYRQPTTDSQVGDNLCIWSTDAADRKTDDNRELLKFSAKVNSQSTSSDQVVWRDDDQIVALCHNGHAEFYGVDKSGQFTLIQKEALRATSESSVHIAPHRCGGPARAIIYDSCTQDKPKGQMKVVTITSAGDGLRRTLEFDKVDSIECKWSGSGSYMLCVASAQVDSRGQNYGSVGDVWLVNYDQIAHSPMIKINSSVVQDAQWRPGCHNVDEFIMIEGKSPSHCSLVGIKLTTTNTAVEVDTHVFHRGYKNTIRWCPKGDLFVIGGFGNLAGDLTFFQRLPTPIKAPLPSSSLTTATSSSAATSPLAASTNASEGLVKVICENRRCPCTVKCEWSPCGRYFLTASLWPRMRVDNHVTVWSRVASKLLEKPVDILYDVEWADLSSEARKWPELPPILESETSAELERSGGNADIFRPKARQSGGATNSNASGAPAGSIAADYSDLIQAYISGKMRLDELPNHLQAKMKTRRSNTAKASTKTVEPKSFWRGGKDESTELLTSASGTGNITHAAAVMVPAMPAPLGKKTKNNSPGTSSKAARSAEPPTASTNRDETVKKVDSTEIRRGLGPAPANPGLLPNKTVIAPNSSVVPPPPPPVNITATPQLLRPAETAKGQNLPPPPPPLASMMLLQQQYHQPAVPSMTGPAMPSTGGIPNNNIMSLLQQILPPTSTVHIENNNIVGRPNGGAGVPPPPPPPTKTGTAMPPPPPPPPVKWYYTDPRGTVQGPFSKRQMRAWWEKGYFPHSLRVKMEHERDFRPLSCYYPEVDAAFTF